MTGRKHVLVLLTGAALWALTAGWASAARLVVHYAPVDGTGVAVPRPSGPCGGVGEVRSAFGRVTACITGPPRPTHWAVFRHPCTGRAVVVPLRLPESTPRMEYRRDRAVYNYGSDTVEVVFLADGGVDVVYNGGLLRVP